MINIDLIHQKGYQWHQVGACRAKGYLFDKDKNFYTNEKLASYFDNTTDEDDFVIKLKQAGGLFSVICKVDETIYFAGDLVRMFPLFYVQQNQSLWLGDDPSEAPVSFTVDDLAEKEFLATGFTAGNRTLMSGVKQLQAGEYGIYSSGKLSFRQYKDYLSDNMITVTDVNKAQQLFINILDSTFRRYISAFKDAFFVLPLSGGFDSRLIACMLKEFDCKNVLCYTYGREGNDEIAISKQVAEILNFDWKYIRYDENIINGYIDEMVFQSYFRFSSKYTSQFFMQEYFAIKYLHDHEVIPRNAIFIPGHSGDFLGGSHLTGRIKTKASKSALINEIFYRNYVQNPPNAKDSRKMKKNLAQEISDQEVPAYSLIENWDWKERQAKLIVNSCNVYNYFGYRHCLPLWDTALFDFFRDLSFPLKYNKVLYEKVLFRLFDEMDVLLAVDRRMQQPPVWKSRIKLLARRIMPKKLEVKLHSKNKDPHFYLPVVNEMIKDMKKNRYPVNSDVKYANAIIIQWYLYQLTCQRAGDRLT